MIDLAHGLPVRIIRRADHQDLDPLPECVLMVKRPAEIILVETPPDADMTDADMRGMVKALVACGCTPEEIASASAVVEPDAMPAAVTRAQERASLWLLSYKRATQPA
jgi:hypothetical protein